MEKSSNRKILLSTYAGILFCIMDLHVSAEIREHKICGQLQISMQYIYIYITRYYRWIYKIYKMNKCQMDRVCLLLFLSTLVTIENTTNLRVQCIVSANNRIAQNSFFFNFCETVAEMVWHDEERCDENKSNTQHGYIVDNRKTERHLQRI